MSPATAKQPPPTGDGIDVTESIIALPVVGDELAQDFARRSLKGRLEYGTSLKTHNGRDAVVDAYQELLDAAVYLHQAWLELPEARTEWDPYSRRDLLKSLRDESIRMAETMRRRLLTLLDFKAHEGSPTLQEADE